MGVLAEKYRQRIKQEMDVARIDKLVNAGKAKYRDAYEYADATSAHLFDEMLSTEALTTEEMRAALVANCEDVLDMASRVQKRYNSRAALGLNPVDINVPMDRIDGLVKHLFGLDEIDEGQEEAVRNLARSNVDKTMRENAEYQYRSGVGAYVTREYDGVGLKEGQCKWCMDRAGSRVPYPVAVAMGMFERHQGCGCMLEYHTEKGTAKQVDWTRNRWEGPADQMERRRTHGL